MVKFNDVNKMKEEYISYVNEWFKKIEEKGITLGDDIKLKLNHGISMCDYVANTTSNSGFFNESYKVSGAVDDLLHDVGRFPQYYVSGTLKDDVSKELTGYLDHGRYGEYYLTKDNKQLLRRFIGENKEYDKVITEVVKEHTTILNPNYKLEIKDLTNIFQNYDINEVLSSKEEIINKLIALKLLILREEDSLEILHKVKDGLWKPMIYSTKDKYINDEVWNIFINQGYINMAELKEKGLWSANVGFLLRYSLIFNNVNFTGTLKTLIEDNVIDTIFINQKNNSKDELGNIDLDNVDPRLEEAKNYMNLALKNLIEYSNDSKIITKEIKEEAKIKTLKQFK